MTTPASIKAQWRKLRKKPKKTHYLVKAKTGTPMITWIDGERKKAWLRQEEVTFGPYLSPDPCEYRIIDLLNHPRTVFGSVELVEINPDPKWLPQNYVANLPFLCAEGDLN